MKATREIVKAQIEDLQRKATERPGEEDSLGIVGFMATLVVSKLQALVLQAEKDSEI